MGIIYAIVNIIDDKHYVGQAADKNKRWKNHRIALQYNKHPNRYLQSAHNKHGAETFIYVVLEKIFNDLLLTEREQYWMDILKVCDSEHGYNLAPAAGSPLGVRHTDETKLNWSKQRKGKKRSAEFGLSVSIRMTGKIITEETRNKLIASHTGYKHSDGTKAKMSEQRKGNKFAAGIKQTKNQIESRMVSI